MRPLAAHAVAPTRGLALIRVSKERDGMTSPEVQRHAIESFAKAQGIRILDYVEGIDESGSRAKSAWWPRLDQAIARMESGEFDAIVVWKFSRTARNRLKWAIALDRVDTLGGVILSATEPIESATASGKFARGLLGEVNAYQADLIGETWKETLERRVRAGLPATGRPRFGYVWDGGIYTPDPATAPVVREMYRRVIAGNGLASITRWVNDQGHRTRHGNLFQTINVTRYLDRGFAAGLIWSKGQLHPGAHEALIDTETWDAFRARRASAVRPPRGRVLMLSGMLRCGTCGGPMMASGSNDRSSGQYVCAARPRGGACAAPAAIIRGSVEDAVTAWIIGLPAKVAELREAERAEREQRQTSIEDRAAISKLIRRGEERLSTLTMKLLDESITQAAYDATAVKLNENLTALRARFTLAAPPPESRLHEEIPTVVAGWSDLPPDGQNRAARTLIDRIIVRHGRGPGRVDIVPRWAPRN